MVDTTATFIRDSRMRTVISRRPILNRMTCSAVRSEHTSMKCRVAVTADASRRDAFELARGMTALTCHICMSARQWEDAVIEFCIPPP